MRFSPLFFHSSESLEMENLMLLAAVAAIVLFSISSHWCGCQSHIFQCRETRRKEGVEDIEKEKKGTKNVFLNPGEIWQKIHLEREKERKRRLDRMMTREGGKISQVLKFFSPSFLPVIFFFTKGVPSSLPPIESTRQAN